MKRLLVASVLAFVATVLTTDTASAQNVGRYGFLPFGFYQPFGATYSTSIRTPPYFSTNPPVYYGARHARPYGLSPFASPPLVSAGERYESRLRTQFLQPQVPTPQPLCNPYVSHSAAVKKVEVKNVEAKKVEVKNVEAKNVQVKPGIVRTNPFVETDKRIAKK